MKMNFKEVMKPDYTLLNKRAKSRVKVGRAVHWPGSQSISFFFNLH